MENYKKDEHKSVIGFGAITDGFNMLMSLIGWICFVIVVVLFVLFVVNIALLISKSTPIFQHWYILGFVSRVAVHA